MSVHPGARQVRRWANFVSALRHCPPPHSPYRWGPIHRQKLGRHLYLQYIIAIRSALIIPDSQTRVRDSCTHPALPGPRVLRFFAATLLPAPDSSSKVRIAACIVSTGHSLRVYLVPVVARVPGCWFPIVASQNGGFPSLADTMRAPSRAPRLLMDMCSRFSPD